MIRLAALFLLIMLAGFFALTPSVDASDWLEAPRRYEHAGQAMDDAGLIRWHPVPEAAARLYCAGTVACAILLPGGLCAIWIADHLLTDDDLKDHERSHCAGWRHD